MIGDNENNKLIEIVTLRNIHKGPWKQFITCGVCGTEYIAFMGALEVVVFILTHPDSEGYPSQHIFVRCPNPDCGHKENFESTEIPLTGDELEKRGKVHYVPPDFRCISNYLPVFKNS